MRAGFEIMAMAGYLASMLAQANPTIGVRTGDRVVVESDGATIRGRIGTVTPDAIVVRDGGTPITIPMTGVRRIDRVGDSLFNGAAIGAAVGGGSTLALMAHVCDNSGCAETSSSLDPRLTLVGSLIGAGIGALLDRAFEGRTTVFPGGATAGPSMIRPSRLVFGSVGRARLTDDQGSLGSGTAAGTGLRLVVWRDLAVQVGYDRHRHRRQLDPDARSGTATSASFNGVEQIVTGKALFLFREGRAVRPYAGFGVSLLHSNRVSESPTFTTQSSGRSGPGPPEVVRRRSREAGLGFAAGVDGGVTSHLAWLADLTLDITHPSALGSTRLSIGIGWRF